MSVSTTEQTRIFKYNQIELDDFDPTISVEQIKEFYADVYPGLTQCIVEGPEYTERGLEYTFRQAAGTKGSNGSVSVKDIAYGNETFPMNIKFAVNDDFMQAVAGIILRSSPDVDDAALAPSLVQGVV